MLLIRWFGGRSKQLNILLLMDKKILQDVVLIRLVLIIILVLYHAFAIYNGAWSMPDGIDQVRPYWWIATISYSFMLETFVFLSGYVFGFQIRERYKGEISFTASVVTKAKRLLLPNMVFSIIYMCLFASNEDISFLEQVYNIINGVGHMWFLPMLFWCFLILYFLERLHVSSKMILCLSLLASVLCIVSLPLRLSSTLYYFLFFYLGYYIQRYNLCLNSRFNLKSVIYLGLSYILILIVMTLIFNSDLILALSQGSISHKIAYHILKRVSTILYSLFGVSFLYVLINYLLKSHSVVLPKTLLKFSSYCFGVYLFQQFILKVLIYNDWMVLNMGTYWVPWVSFYITLFCSLVLSWAFVKTRIGKFLIG